MGEWFDLHGIFYTHYGSNPQCVLPSLSVNTPVTLQAIDNNPYDKYAVAVFTSNKYIGWVPSGTNKKFHNLLINDVNCSAKIVRLYDIDGGIGATIYITFSENITSFNPLSVKPTSFQNTDLTLNEINFLKYLAGKSIENPKIAKYWINDFGIIYKISAEKFIKYNLLTFSDNQKTKKKTYALTEKGKEVVDNAERIQTLKIYELNAILNKYSLPTRRSKQDAINSIYDNISNNKINEVLHDIENGIEIKKRYTNINNKKECYSNCSSLPHYTGSTPINNTINDKRFAEWYTNEPQKDDNNSNENEQKAITYTTKNKGIIHILKKLFKKLNNI